MTTKLRLWRGDAETEQTEEPRTLRFPVEAVSAMPAPARPRRGGAVVGRVRPSIRPTQPGGTDELVRHIEETLDRVQSRFDDLKSQLAESYRLTFPRNPDGPRPAA